MVISELGLEVGKPRQLASSRESPSRATPQIDFRRSVEMAYTQVAVDDDDSLARLLKRRQQEFGGVDRGAIGGAHRLTL